MSSERPPLDDHPTLEMLAVKRPEQEKLLRSGFATQSSLRHPEINEDALLLDEKRGVLAVFDGVGGSGGLGEIASRLAKNELSPEQLEAAFQAAPNGLKASFERMRHIFGSKTQDTPLERHQVEMAMHDALMHLNDQIEVAGQRRKSGKKTPLNPIGTTGTLGKIWQNKEGKSFLTLGNSGDSRAYVFRGGRLIRLTHDQSYVQMLIDAHVLTNDQDVTKTVTADQVSAVLQKRPELANIFELLTLSHEKKQTIEELRRMISQYLGLASTLKQNGRDFTPEVTTTALESGDILILTTDGVHDNLLDGEMEIIAKRFADNPQGLADMLVSKASDASNDLENPRAKPDDMSATVQRIQ